MGSDVRVEQRLGRPLAVVCRLASQYQLSKVVPDACGTVWKVIRSQKIPDAGRHVAIYLDSQINLEVGVELDTPFAGHGEVVSSDTPSGMVAFATHYGPYGSLHETHEAIIPWCRRHNCSLAGPSWESFGHWKDEWNSDPSQIWTEVCCLVTTPD